MVSGRGSNADFPPPRPVPLVQNIPSPFSLLPQHREDSPHVTDPIWHHLPFRGASESSAHLPAAALCHRRRPSVFP